MKAWVVLRRVPNWIYPLAIAVILGVLPILGLLDFSLERQIQLALLLALIVSGLNLGFGYGGQLAMGQPAMYATGAYVAAIISRDYTSEIILQLVAGGIGALIVGIITGIPGLRLGSWSLAMTSFFLVLLIPDIAEMTKGVTGGAQGLIGMHGPTIFGVPLPPDGMYTVIIVVTTLWFVIFRNLIVSRHGIAFRLLKESPVLASSLGISVYRMKLLSYAMGAVPAGLAGVLFANLDLYITPGEFGFALATTAIAASVLGGSASIYGAIIGGFVLQFGQNQAANLQAWSLLVFGAYLIIGGVLLRSGVAGLGRSLVARLDRSAQRVLGIAPPTSPLERPALPPQSGAKLVVAGVSKAFGGNQALAGADLTAEPGHITALIGPNGSGKTTLLNVICGFYRIDSGSITLDGTSILKSTPDAIARRGIARTFQTPSVPEGISVRQAVASGRYAFERASVFSTVLRMPRYRRVRRADDQRVDRMLALTGLSDAADMEAKSLPLGRRRMLEVARAMISQPKLLLLDEAASGLDEDEVERLAVVVRDVRDAGGTIILVEHNFKLVLALADDIYVLSRGSLLAHGTADQIERDANVQREYLGSELEVEALAENAPGGAEGRAHG